MVRFRLSTALVLIALLSATIAYIIKPFFWDQPRCRRLARYHETQADIYSKRADEARASCITVYDKLMNRSRWHRSMSARYRRAATYPDMPIPIESPLPPIE